MKNITAIDSETKLTKADVALLEQKLGMNLPMEYKKFLLLHNGGHPEKDCYPAISSKISGFYGTVFEGSDLAWFYAFYDGEYSNLLKEYSRFKDRIPEGFVPIARDSFSNKICLCLNGSEYGKIYFWEFDYAVPYGEEPTFDNMYLLANNFTDFINSLYEFVDIKKDINGKKVLIYSHDKYSLPFSTQAKEYGDLTTNFFAKAPAEVEDYIIEETESTKDLLLWYEVKSENKKYYRKISETRQIMDYQE